MPIDGQHETRVFRLKVQGTLAGSCVSALEIAWRTASAAHDGKTRIVDLTEVACVDEPGRDLLSRTHQTGAILIVSPTLGDSILRPKEATGK
jgi:hypothetical protein